jgi:hypothetical protein
VWYSTGMRVNGLAEAMTTSEPRYWWLVARPLRLEISARKIRSSCESRRNLTEDQKEFCTKSYSGSSTPKEFSRQANRYNLSLSRPEAPGLTKKTSAKAASKFDINVHTLHNRQSAVKCGLRRSRKRRDLRDYRAI